MCTLDIILNELKKQHKSQKELAEHLGMSKNAVSEWKSGRNEAYKKYLPQIAEFLGVTVAYLSGESTQTTPSSSLSSVDNIKFALFGDTDVDDEVLDDVKRYALIARQMREQKKKESKKE